MTIISFTNWWWVQQIILPLVHDYYNCRLSVHLRSEVQSVIHLHPISLLKEETFLSQSLELLQLLTKMCESSMWQLIWHISWQLHSSIQQFNKCKSFSQFLIQSENAWLFWLYKVHSLVKNHSNLSLSTSQELMKF